MSDEIKFLYMWVLFTKRLLKDDLQNLKLSPTHYTYFIIGSVQNYRYNCGELVEFLEKYGVKDE